MASLGITTTEVIEYERATWTARIPHPDKSAWTHQDRQLWTHITGNRTEHFPPSIRIFARGDPYEQAIPIHDPREPWFTHQFGGELIKMKPEGWQALGANPRIVKTVQGAEFLFRYPPPTSVDLDNHPAFKAHATQADSQLEDNIQSGVIEL